MQELFSWLDRIAEFNFWLRKMTKKEKKKEIEGKIRRESLWDLPIQIQITYGVSLRNEIFLNCYTQSNQQTCSRFKIWTIVLKWVEKLSRRDFIEISVSLNTLVTYFAFFVNQRSWNVTFTLEPMNSHQSTAIKKI